MTQEQIKWACPPDSQCKRLYCTFVSTADIIRWK